MKNITFKLTNVMFNKLDETIKLNPITIDTTIYMLSRYTLVSIEQRLTTSILECNYIHNVIISPKESVFSKIKLIIKSIFNICCI